MGRPLAAWPGQAALKEKSWTEKQQQILLTTTKWVKTLTTDFSPALPNPETNH